MTPTRFLAMLCLVLAALGCSHTAEPGYPSDVIHEFLHSCEQQATQAACNCAIDRIQRAIPLDEFRKIEDAMRRGEHPPQSLIDAASACR